MNILITGSNGFIGKNLCVALKGLEGVKVFEYDLDSPPGLLAEELARAEVIFHLAGVNRPQRVEEFEKVNAGLTEKICQYFEATGRKPLIVLASSTQAELDNPYGRSKKLAEEVLIDFADKTGAPVHIFRLPGVFGKWSRPNYNTVVATFCHNIARDLPISISDPTNEISLVYIDDVVEAFISEVRGQKSEISEPRTEVRENKTEIRDPRSEDELPTTDLGPRASVKREAAPVYRITLGELVEIIRGFRESRNSLMLADMNDRFVKCLYATYLSFLPQDAFAYDLKQNKDDRGELAELLKSPHMGQIFVSRTRPGITRGNHYHDLKV